MLFFAFVLLFITKIRFPPHRSLYSIILKRYNGEVLKLLRSYEKDDFKLSKSQADLDFLISCQTHNLIPKFLQFKLYAKNICNRNEYKRYQKRLLQGEIDSKTAKKTG